MDKLSSYKSRAAANSFKIEAMLPELFSVNAEAFQQNAESAMNTAILVELERTGLPVAEIESCLQNGRFANER